MQMFEAFLFDLDGTLLNLDMDYFLPHYFARMHAMAYNMEYKNADFLVPQIWSSTEEMISNTDPNKTNEEVFFESFFQNWPYTVEEFKPFFDIFYQEEFPRLRKYGKPFPGVPQMMEKLSARGVKIVIATNPVFPLTAIEQRLEWAGVGHLDYDLITTYENMHFCKPQPAYYEEICDYIGVKPNKCLMVGNDTGEDLIAGQLGIKTFLLTNMLIDKGAPFKPDWRGELEQLFNFLEKI
jgi:FMN phosphatase YigB (HAD superfamily)